MDEKRKRFPKALLLVGLGLVGFGMFLFMSDRTAPYGDGESDERFDVYSGARESADPASPSSPQVEAPGSHRRSPTPLSQPDSQPSRAASSQPAVAPDGPTKTVPKARPRPEGVLGKEEVQLGIEAFKPVAKHCYEQLLEDFPEASGKVALRFTVQAADGFGEVVMSEIDKSKTEVHDGFFHDCLTTSIASVEFETEQTGATDVTYPFRFEREKPALQKQVIEPGMEEEVEFDEPGGEPEPKEEEVKNVDDYAP
jgi:hypothetical protein